MKDQSVINKHLLMVVNVDWFFLSHRLPIALAARAAGMRVTVAAADTGRRQEIEKHGLHFEPLRLTRGMSNPWADSRTLFSLIGLYRRLHPDIIHHVTIKPVLYGSLAARLVSNAAVVNAISGLGYVFSGAEMARWIRRLSSSLYRIALGHPRSKTIFQNQDDLNDFVRARAVTPGNAVLIRGSGVDCAHFQPVPEPAGPPVVVLASRMLWDKGVLDFVNAVQLLRAQGVAARFTLVGDVDPDNPASIPRAQLEQWRDAGIVEWWGARTDMNAIMQQATIVVLPSRREGLPKVLIEAAASGRPIVTTDVPGCREVVRNGVNGLLVPVGDVPALAAAMGELLADPALRNRMGQAGRQRAESEFAIELVVDQTMDVYRSLL